MSLQLAAKHLSNQGRGPDDTLVHMSRGEVKSLNDLAMAHGGQLTINPETGLPEAGFLSAILPMVAGAALASTGVGAPMAAMMVGGGSYLLNPKAGLMGALSAGMGAYGGYGFGEGLTSLGASSEAGLTSTGASMDYAAQNAEAIKNAQAFEQAKLAQNAEAIKAAQAQTDLLSDFGPRGEFTSMSAPLPTSPGGMNLQPKFNIPGWSQESMQEYIAKGQPTNLSASDVDFLSRAGGDPNKFGGPLQGAKYIGSDIEQFAVKQPSDSLLRNPLTENQLGQSATGFDTMKRGAQSLINDPTGEKFKTLGGGSYMGLAKQGLAAAAPIASEGLKPAGLNVPKTQQKAQVVPHYKFSPGMVTPTPAAGATGTENTYFNPSYTALSDQESQQLYPGYPVAQAAGGGLMAFGAGGEANSYRTTPDDSLETAYTKAEEKNDTATMRAIEREMEIRDTNKAGMTKGLSGMQGLAMGGLSNARYNLGGYSDGGRLLRGPGDGVSDSIPAVIGKKQPARLADGEFVVPARIVSEIGNGSTEAGARKLYAMMDRIQAARGKTVGKGKVAKNTRADKYLPA